MNDMPPVHAVFAVDMKKFSGRSGPAQSDAHSAIQHDVRRAFSRAELDWGKHVEEVEDTGDGVMITVAAKHLHRLVDRVVPELDRALRLREHSGGQRLRLRVAVHDGPIDAAERTGPAKVVAARLLNSEPPREVLDRYERANIALIISDRSYTSAVEPGYGAVVPSLFTDVWVHNKEYEGRAWVFSPGEGRVELGERQSPASGEGRHRARDPEPADRATGGTDAEPSGRRARADRGGQMFHQNSGTQVAGDVQGDLNVSDIKAGRDVVSGDSVQQGDVVHRDKNVSNDTVHGRKGDTVHGDKRGE